MSEKGRDSTPLQNSNSLYPHIKKIIDLGTFNPGKQNYLFGPTLKKAGSVHVRVLTNRMRHTSSIFSQIKIRLQDEICW